jgi:hypothetical protein
MAISSALGSSALLPAGLGFRNKIINGDMRIAQRGTATITGSGTAQYPVDRWAVYNGTGTVTFAQSTDAPAGFTNSILATVTATGSYSTSGYTQITHKIEGFNCQDLAYGTTSAKTIVFSFWVKSSVVGIQNVSFKNSGNNRVYVSKYTVDVANTWEKKTITVVGDTTGTWLVDSGVGLEVTFNLGMGTTYDVTDGSWQAAAAKYSTSDAIDFAANSGATFRVTGVQLEANTQPTPFEQRPYGVELALCQRYYQRWQPYSYQYQSIGYTSGQGVGSAPAVLPLSAYPRTFTTANVSLTFSSASHFECIANTGLATTATDISLNGLSPSAMSIRVSGTFTTNVPYEFRFNNTSAFLALSMEL